MCVISQGPQLLMCIIRDPQNLEALKPNKIKDISEYFKNKFLYTLWGLSPEAAHPCSYGMRAVDMKIMPEDSPNCNEEVCH